MGNRLSRKVKSKTSMKILTDVSVLLNSLNLPDDFTTTAIYTNKKDFDKIPKEWFFTNRKICANEREINKLVSLGLKREELIGDYFIFILEEEC